MVDPELSKLLRPRSVAVVGASAREGSTGLRLLQHLQMGGFAGPIYPINPRYPDILGIKCHPSLSDVPEKVDVVNVFRAPDALPGIARDAVAIGASTLWCQFGVINEEGAQIAEDGGVTVIMDRCLKVEHARYVGRMHWLGFNTQRITSARGGLQ